MEQDPIIEVKLYTIFVSIYSTMAALAIGSYVLAVAGGCLALIYAIHLIQDT